MIDLTKTTFIIPIQVESEDRYNNARVVLGYLNHYFKTNVFIYEKNDEYKSKLDFLDTFKNLTITYFLEKNNDDFFHRTKFLNNMLRNVETPVVCNYDIDVILEPRIYELSQQYILDNKVDVVYPYGEGWFQKQILQTQDKDEFIRNWFNLNTIPQNKINIHTSICGHCMFFNTKVYKEFGGENQLFKSYGAEDSERYHRFTNLARVGRIPSFVYHWEHSRNHHSSPTNPYFEHNERTWEYLRNLSKEELKNFYSTKVIY